MKILCTICCTFLSLYAFPQAGNIVVQGKVAAQGSGKLLEGVQVFVEGTVIVATTDETGAYHLTISKPGKYQLGAFYAGLQTEVQALEVVAGRYEVNFSLKPLDRTLDEVEIRGAAENNLGITRLHGVESAAIYEGKKNEVITIKELNANLATNNSRQIYAKVPGLNIWQSDGAGLQLGIGARGLDPNRTSNFNVRQNGYDISADALGYPESYYTPPAEALDRIEVVRGAASLQYGTQFGGLLNFVMKKGPEDKPIELTTRQSAGSFGLFNSFNSLGGTVGKLNYYGFYQHKQAEGWRPNESFNLNMAYGSLIYTPIDKLSLTFQYTYMHYLAQQPGGLTDAFFEENPRQSVRDRNWFRVDWNLMAFLIDYQLTDKLKLNMRNFGLVGGRDALGNLGRIDRVDDQEPRNLFVDDFQNFGNETRLIYAYDAFSQPAALLVGGRYYHGLTHRQQGLGSSSNDADFTFLHPNHPEDNDYNFPGRNVSLFAENVFNISNKLSITPGVRFEYIRTAADGYYQRSVLVADPVTGLATDSLFDVEEQKERNRSFLFYGLGLSYKATDMLELYGNLSQNYRSINFNDIRVVNPNQQVDPDIQDEDGYNLDLGIRGSKGNLFNYDVSLFYLQYNDRIGSILQVDEATYRIYRYRTNIADSRHIGLESFGEFNILKWMNPHTKNRLSLFGNLALIQAQYIHTEDPAISGRKVELVPDINIKTGLSYASERLKISYQFSHTSSQFSDASNAVFTPSAVEGIIPAYDVMDLALSYHYRWAGIETGINNLTNNYYFTRRASGYPGPGIIPADGRSFYVTLQLQW